MSREESSALPSPGESPQLGGGDPWDALLSPNKNNRKISTIKPSTVSTKNVDNDTESTRPWRRHLPFSRLNLSNFVGTANVIDKDGVSPLLFKYRQTRYSSRRIRKRVVFKHGDVNVVQGNVAKRRRRYLQDIFTTLVDAQWRWTLLVFSMNFILSWLMFALMWWLIAYAHGDLQPENNPAIAASLAASYKNTSEIEMNENWTPCVAGISTFTSCFLFSVETQHTIGYGGRSTSEECPEAIFIMCVQSIVGVMIQAFMVGIVFVKLSRPIKRTHTLLFSRNAVICQRDGRLCLMFRVGDMRKSHIIEAHVRAQFIKRKVTQEGELLPFHQIELKVGGDGVEDRIFFIWPTTIVHVINSESPLYRLSAADMLRERFEIVVVLEGIVESTGMTTQARSSYLPSEILWGHRFESLVTFKKETGEYEVDYSLFNHTYQIDTPLCSPADLDLVLNDARASQERSELGDMGSINSSRIHLVAQIEKNNFPTREDIESAVDNSSNSEIKFSPSTFLKGDLEGVTIVVNPLDLPGPESRI